MNGPSSTNAGRHAAAPPGRRPSASRCVSSRPHGAPSPTASRMLSRVRGTRRSRRRRCPPRASPPARGRGSAGWRTGTSDAATSDRTGCGSPCQGGSEDDALGNHLAQPTVVGRVARAVNFATGMFQRCVEGDAALARKRCGRPLPSAGRSTRRRQVVEQTPVVEPLGLVVDRAALGDGDVGPGLRDRARAGASATACRRALVGDARAVGRERGALDVVVDDVTVARARCRARGSGCAPWPGSRRTSSLSRAKVTPQKLKSWAWIRRPSWSPVNCSRSAIGRPSAESRIVVRVENCRARVGVAGDERGHRADAPVGRHARAARQAGEGQRVARRALRCRGRGAEVDPRARDGQAQGAATRLVEAQAGRALAGRRSPGAVRG
jgi:hypothetical protein